MRSSTAQQHEGQISNFYFLISPFRERLRHLYVALDQKYISKEAFQKIYKQAEKVSKMDSGFIKYLRSQLNKPSASEIHASDNGAYLTGPINPKTA